jgi:sialic acid synthase SpsE
MAVTIGSKKIGKEYPVYFIADIASNHGGDLEMAKDLIYACAESGVDAVKMQNFSADTIVSDYGFKNLHGIQTHQSSWDTSVFESYKAASIPFDWTQTLKELSEKLGMAYFTSPYSLELVRAVAPYVAAFKLGSGDITWHEEIEAMAGHRKTILIATGASDLKDIKSAVRVALNRTKDIVLLQCNTNYTAKHGEAESLTRERFSNLNLKVLQTYANLWPEIPIGLSDHTLGNLSVLAAVGLFDCCVVEKHLTLDSSLQGQDHSFSMMPGEWSKMVRETRELKKLITPDQTYDKRLSITKRLVDNPEYLELAIGNGIKKVQENERNTAIVQRRSIRAKRLLKMGDTITRDDLIVLRPCPPDALPPYQIHQLLGKVLLHDINEGDYLKASSVGGDVNGID